jgi:hypothetical protein
MPSMDDLHAARAKDGLVVVGASDVEMSGTLFLSRESMTDRSKGTEGWSNPAAPDRAAPGQPAPLKDTPEQATLRAAIALKAYKAHLTKFREKTGIQYPFMVMTDEVKEAFWGRSGRPTTMIVDRDGKVALVTVGAYKDQLHHQAIDVALKAKPAAAAPKGETPAGPAPAAGAAKESPKTDGAKPDEPKADMPAGT